MNHLGTAAPRAVRASVLPMLCAIAAAAQAEDVVIYSWQGTQAGQVSQLVIYSGPTGLVSENLVRAPGQDSSWMRAADMVLLETTLVMNDDLAQTSMVIDPDDMPQLPNPFGAGGAGAGGEVAAAMQQAQQAMQQAMQDPQLQNNPAAQQMLQGLLGGGMVPQAAAPTAALQFAATGNSGSTNGIAWQEFEAQIGPDSVRYRLADWDAVEGAEQLVGHYATMSRIYEAMLANSGFGQFLQGFNAWPQAVVAYMVENRKLPVHMDDGNGSFALTAIERGTLDDGRFGARYAVQNPFAGF